MSSPIMPIQGLRGPTDSISPSRGNPSDMAAFEAEMAASMRMLGGELTDPSSSEPPPEVLDQLAVAGRISRQMRESGHELRFSDGPGGRVTVELLDREGNTLRTMRVAEALEIAAGKPLD